MMGISSDDPDISCPDCHRLMIRLDNYELAIDGQGPGDGIADYTPQIDEFRGLLFLDGLINILFAWRHRVKSRQICQRFLPDWPGSMVCPACLFVYKRR
jgi:hypothetical protein